MTISSYFFKKQVLWPLPFCNIFGSLPMSFSFQKVKAKKRSHKHIIISWQFLPQEGVTGRDYTMADGEDRPAAELGGVQRTSSSTCPIASLSTKHFQCMVVTLWSLDRFMQRGLCWGLVNTEQLPDPEQMFLWDNALKATSPLHGHPHKSYQPWQG